MIKVEVCMIKLEVCMIKLGVCMIKLGFCMIKLEICMIIIITMHSTKLYRKKYHSMSPLPLLLVLRTPNKTDDTI